VIFDYWINFCWVVFTWVKMGVAGERGWMLRHKEPGALGNEQEHNG
jgi:hypothetical protein